MGEFRSKGHGDDRRTFPVSPTMNVGKPLPSSRFVHPSRQRMHDARMTPKYRIVYADKFPWYSYLGMNWYAAKELRLKFPYGRNTIVVNDELDSSTKSRVVSHEKAEIKLMKAGMKYCKAHALVEERQGHPEAW